MILTEEQAIKKTCPYLSSPSPQMRVMCEGSGCMGWRWAGWRDAQFGDLYANDTASAEGDEPVGYCAFKPEYQVELPPPPERETSIVVLPSPEEVQAAMTPAGGWTRETLAGWGIGWPPPRGWRQRLAEAYGELHGKPA